MKLTIGVLLVSALVLGFSMSGCTDSPTAARALSAFGLKNITTEGYAWFGCGEGDTFHTRFRAQNQQGQIVTGVVCSGWLKGSTVRLD